MFLSRNKKNNVYPCKPQFDFTEVGFKGSKLYRHVFMMFFAPVSVLISCYSYVPLSFLSRTTLSFLKSIFHFLLVFDRLSMSYIFTTFLLIVSGVHDHIKASWGIHSNAYFDLLVPGYLLVRSVITGLEYLGSCRQTKTFILLKDLQ